MRGHNAAFSETREEPKIPIVSDGDVGGTTEAEIDGLDTRRDSSGSENSFQKAFGEPTPMPPGPPLRDMLDVPPSSLTRSGSQHSQASTITDTVSALLCVPIFNRVLTCSLGRRQ